MRRHVVPIFLALCAAVGPLTGCASYHPPLDRTLADGCEILAAALVGYARKDPGTFKDVFLARRTYAPGWSLLDGGSTDGWTRTPDLELSACPALVAVLPSVGGVRLSSDSRHRLDDTHLSSPAVSPDGRQAVVIFKRLSVPMWALLRKVDGVWVYDHGWFVVSTG